MRRTLLAALAVALLVGAAACSDDGDADDGGTTDDSAPASADEEATALGASFDPAAVGEVSISPPASEGAGQTILSAGGLDLAPLGYEQEELFVSGTASAYASDEPLAEDGEWTVTPAEQADYTTRVVVRRPVDAAAFNGNVIVEWLNVSGGLDADPDWVYTHVELIREGWAWIGVSAQAGGLQGSGLGASFAPVAADPVRYGPLDHPGDEFSYDIYSQVGAAARTQPDALLGGLEAARVLAIGESQSAFRLTSYLDAVAPLANVYDGYLVHSRAGRGAPIGGLEPPEPTAIRTDLDVPVLIFSAETDLTVLDYARARQDDTDLVRGWEVAGTAHADAYNLGIGDTDDGSGAADQALFDAMLDPPDSVYGGVISCEAPLNAGPHTYVLRAAVRGLDTWVRTGEAPPTMPRIELTDDLLDTVTDASGNAVGGIRTPHVDAPVAVLSGQGQSGDGFCGLFGTTRPLDPPVADRAAWLERWGASLDDAVAAGVILEPDADHLRTVAEQSAVGG